MEAGGRTEATVTVCAWTKQGRVRTNASSRQLHVLAKHQFAGSCTLVFLFLPNRNISSRTWQVRIYDMYKFSCYCFVNTHSFAEPRPLFPFAFPPSRSPAAACHVCSCVSLAGLFQSLRKSNSSSSSSEEVKTATALWQGGDQRRTKKRSSGPMLHGRTPENTAVRVLGGGMSPEGERKRAGGERGHACLACGRRSIIAVLVRRCLRCHPPATPPLRT